MAGIKLSPFGGMSPKIGKRLLSAENAAIASNVKLHSGELHPIRQLKVIVAPNKPLPAISAFLARSGLSSTAWLTWDFDTNAIRVPLDIDVESRFVWTGEGTPKMATYSQAVLSGNNDYPSNFWELGIPVPKTKPSVSSSGGVGIATTRAYVYTYRSALGEESSASPVSELITGKVDDTWAITGMDEVPLNSGTGTAIFASGITTFTNAASARSWLRTGDEVIIAGDAKIVLSVPTADSYTISGDYSAATTWARKTNWNTVGMIRLLYRTVGTASAFQLVAEDVGTSYNDTLLDGAILGDELISLGWLPPPVGLKGIVVHSSGSLVGFVGNILHMSIPYQPHAWFSDYQISLAHEIVGIGTFGSEVVAGTKGSPYIISGVEPESMASRKVDMYPCLSKRGLISVGDAVIYPSSHGLVSISNSGVSILTDSFYSKDEWQALNPSSMILTSAYGRIYISYTTTAGELGMVIIDGGLLTLSDIATYGLYTDIETGSLYISNTLGINEWDSEDGYALNYTWRSKDIMFQTPLNIGAAKVDFDNAVDEITLAALTAEQAAITLANGIIEATGNAHGSINSKRYNQGHINGSSFQTPIAVPDNKITFILRSRKGIIISKSVINERAFKLPAGYKTDLYSVEVIAQSPIKEVRIAETMKGLEAL